MGPPPRATAARLFVVSGPSGAGKGTVVRAFLARHPDVFLSVSATTRPARPQERGGADYHFISEPEFAAMRDRGEFLESARVYDNYYGTPRQPVDEALSTGRSVLCELDIQGALAVKRARPHAILVFIEPPSYEELAARLRGRGTEGPEALSVRAQAAYEEIKKKGLYDHVVVNDDLDHAVSELVRILGGHP